MSVPAIGRKCSEIEACLRNAPVGASLEDGWERKLFARHLEFPERTKTILTAVAGQIGNKDGWITLWQEGGGLKIVIWSLNRGDQDLRVEVNRLTGCFAGVVGPGNVQVRWTRPHGFHRAKGWPIADHAA